MPDIVQDQERWVVMLKAMAQLVPLAPAEW
jgi:hypothetical protein